MRASMLDAIDHVVLAVILDPRNTNLLVYWAYSWKMNVANARNIYPFVCTQP